MYSSVRRAAFEVEASSFALDLRKHVTDGYWLSSEDHWRLVILFNFKTVILLDLYWMKRLADAPRVARTN